MITRQRFAQIPLFAGLTEAQLNVLYGLSRGVIYPLHSTLFTEGSRAAHVFILIDGCVSVHVSRTMQAGALVMNTLEQFGQLIGWSGLVPPGEYTATATCIEDSHILVMDVEPVMKALEANPVMGFLVMRQIAQQISTRLQNIERVVMKTL